MYRLIMSHKESAFGEIALDRDFCLSSPDKTLLQQRSPQLHCMIGLYCMSVSLFEQGERQLVACIQATQDRDLKLFANLNLAIVYLRTNRETELNHILETSEMQCMNSQSLMGCFYYVQGLNSFYKSSFQEAKRFLRETLKMANAEDLNRLTSCSLVLLSHVFLSIGNSKESMNMVTPAMQLASKIPDANVQLWGSAILKDLHRMSQEVHQETEAYNNHVTYSQTQLNDQYSATQSPEHALLVNWFSGDPPAQQQNAIAMPSTSYIQPNYGDAQ